MRWWRSPGEGGCWRRWRWGEGGHPGGWRTQQYGISGILLRRMEVSWLRLVMIMTIMRAGWFGRYSVVGCKAWRGWRCGRCWARQNPFHECVLEANKLNCIRQDSNQHSHHILLVGSRGCTYSQVRFRPPSYSKIPCSLKSGRGGGELPKKNFNSRTIPLK